MSVTVTKTEQTVTVTQDNQTVTLTPVTQTVEVAAAGPQGASGTNGTNGTNGQGVPVGGTTGQVLAKINATDYNTQWTTPAAGTVTSVTGTAPIVSSGGTTPAISVTAASTAAAGVVQLSDSTSTTSSTVAATSTAAKAAYDRGSTGVTDAATAQTTANAAIPKSTVTTAGDVIYATGSAAVARLGIGTAGQVLTVNSGATAPQWSTAASGGVTSVTGTAPIVSSGGATPAISVTAASTSASGVVQLSDSVSTTSSLLAATPTAVKTAYDIATAGWEAHTFGTAGVIATVPRFVLTVGTTPASGTIVHSRIIPHRDFTVTNIAFVSSSSASVPTLIRFGIYTRSGTTFTLVARTASDTTIFNATNTKFTRALNTTGGYPATYTMIAGTEYFLSVIQVASTAAQLLTASARVATAANAATGVAYYTDASEADLVTPSTGSASGSIGGLFAEVS